MAVLEKKVDGGKVFRVSAPDDKIDDLISDGWVVKSPGIENKKVENDANDDEDDKSYVQKMAYKRKRR